MRIAYVTEWNPYEQSGVLKKIVGQVAAWKALGFDARIFSLAPLQKSTTAFDFASHGEVIGIISQQNVSRFRAARLGYLNKVASASRLRKAVKAFAPDIIYYRRQGPWYPGLGKILRIAPAVAELNGNAAGEAIWGKLNSSFGMISKQLTDRYISAYVTVSPEIAAEYLGTGKNVKVIPNSLSQKPRPLLPTNNKWPAFVFVGSSLTKGGAWHGVDKIIDLALRLPQCQFEIVGIPRTAIDKDTLPQNVQFHGPKFGAELEEIYQRADIGIGTLALHRRGMEINSALKPLEYLIFGLPVIIGYRETETLFNFSEYTLLIGNHERNVVESLESIVAFSEKWRGRRVTADLGYLSSDVIERRRLDFLETISRRTKSSRRE